MGVTQAHINKAIMLAKEYGATRLILFGSALSDPKNARDLDLAVDGVPGLSVFTLAGEMEIA
jgi:uncharacterized protein